MIRGTTAQFKFKLPCTKGSLEWATIKFSQSNNPNPLLPIVKTLSHCGNPETSHELCVSLTSEETLRFSDKLKAKVQLRAFHSTSGTIFGMKEKYIPVYPMDFDPYVPVDGLDDEYIILDGGKIE